MMRRVPAYLLVTPLSHTYYFSLLLFLTWIPLLPTLSVLHMALRLFPRRAVGRAELLSRVHRARWCSTTSGETGGDEVVARESPIDGVFLLEMHHRTPERAFLSASLMSSFLNTIRTVCDPEKGHARGLVVTCNTPAFFGGELDVEALLTSDQSLFAHYWNQLQQLFTTLHSLPVPTAVVIGGECSTGGTMLALACDYRVMASSCAFSTTSASSAIGMPAVRHGFCVPPYVAGSLERVVGFRRAERLITTGEMLSADDAAACGLVDEVANGVDEAVIPCLEHVEQVLALPSLLPYWIAKDTLRRPVLAPLCTHALRTADTVSMYEMLQNPAVRSTLESLRR